jgi:hypothetical protein
MYPERFGDAGARLADGYERIALLVDDRSEIQRRVRRAAKFDLFPIGVSRSVEFFVIFYYLTYRVHLEGVFLPYQHHSK